VRQKLPGVTVLVPIITLTLVLRALSFPPPAWGQSTVTLEARAGFDGYYKVNGWVPVHVVVTNEGPDVKGEIQLKLPDNLTGQHRSLYTQQAILPTRSRKQFTLYTFVENYSRELTVRLVEREDGARTEAVLAEQTVRVEPLAAEDFLYGVVSDDPSALNYLAGLASIGQRPSMGRVHVAHLKLSDLPTQGRALGSMDALIVHSTDTLSLDDDRRDALRGWIAFGGQLIVCGGPNAIPTAAGLGDLLPVVVNGTLTTTDVETLGDFATAPFIVGVPAVVAQVEPIVSDELSPPRVMAGKADLPLLIRRDLDRGRIDYLALDPDMEPMRTWIGNDALWAKILFSTPLSLRPGHAGFASSKSSGWGSLNAALSNIPSLDLPPVLLVIAFLLFYILIVGPLNFAILRLIDKRALAWISVPVLIILFSCAAYAIGSASRGRQVIVSEIAVVHAQPQSRIASVDTFVGLYSPVRQSYDVRLPDNALVHHMTDVPYSPGGGSSKLLRVEQGPPTYLHKFDIDVGAMRTCAMHSIKPWPDIQADLALSRTGTNAYHIEGTISNWGDVDVQNATLVFDMQPIPIADLAAGTTETISAAFQFVGSNSSQQVIDRLVGPYTTGSEARERERQRAILNNVLPPYPYVGGSPSPSAVQLDGLNLLGWLGTSLDQIDVQGYSQSVNATTLLIAPLPFKSNLHP